MRGMTRRWKVTSESVRTAVCAFAVWAAMAAGAAVAQENGEVGTPVEDTRPPLYLLTIGNSFSNDATRLLPDLAKNAKTRRLEVRRWASLGGHSLKQHAGYLAAWRADPNDPKGRPYNVPEDIAPGKKADLATLLKALPWDVVTIQQLSSDSFRPETFFPYAEELAAAVREFAPTAKLVMQETWAYRPDDGWLVHAGSDEDQALNKHLNETKIDVDPATPPTVEALFAVLTGDAVLADAFDCPGDGVWHAILHAVANEPMPLKEDEKTVTLRRALDFVAGAMDARWAIREGAAVLSRAPIPDQRPLNETDTDALDDDLPFWRRAVRDEPTYPWEVMYGKIAATYRLAAERLGIELLPVGDAFAAATNDPAWGYRSPTRRPRMGENGLEHPSTLAPYNEGSLHVGFRWAANKKKDKDDPTTYHLAYDPRHASTAGQYLGAAVWYASLLDEPFPDDVFVPAGLTKAKAAYLRTLASFTVAAYRAEAKAEADGDDDDDDDDDKLDDEEVDLAE